MTVEDIGGWAGQDEGRWGRSANVDICRLTCFPGCVHSASRYSLPCVFPSSDQRLLKGSVVLDVRRGSFHEGQVACGSSNAGETDDLIFHSFRAAQSIKSFSGSTYTTQQSNFGSKEQWSCY